MSNVMDRLKRNKGLNAQRMKEQLIQNGQTRGKDERIWKYTFDEKSKTSYSRIRFLPIPDCDVVAQENGEIPEDFVLSPAPVVRRHNFRCSTGRYYNAISRQTWGESCPVRDYDRANWKRQKETDDNALKDELKKRIPDTKYYANILVIEDRENPENNGKVMLFQFGNGIKKVIDAASKPKFPTDPRIEDVFDYLEGAELILELEGEERSFGNWTGLVPKDFGRCKWGTPTPLADSDEAIIEIMQKSYSLFDFVDPRKMETYEEQEKRFKEAMGIPQDTPLMANDAFDGEEHDGQEDANIHTNPNQAGAAGLAAKQLQEAEQKRADQLAAQKAATETTTEAAGAQSSGLPQDSMEDDFDSFLDGLE